MIKRVKKNVTTGSVVLEKSDVHHPQHYNSLSFEVIDIIEEFDLNFHLGNVIKYVLRAGKKGCRITDLKKALWYLNREIERSNE